MISTEHYERCYEKKNRSEGLDIYYRMRARK